MSLKHIQRPTHKAPQSNASPDGPAADLPHKTATEIVKKVEALLTSETGRTRLKSLHRLFDSMSQNAAAIRKDLRSARSRATASFYTNASSASGGPTLLSVRVGGVECGELALGEMGHRLFRSRNPRRFGHCGLIPTTGLDWADAAVRRYLERAAKAARDPGTPLTVANRESVVEADLLAAMIKRRPEDRQDSLIFHQPVRYPF